MKKKFALVCFLLSFGSLTKTVVLKNHTTSNLILNNWRSIKPGQKIIFAPGTSFKIKRYGWKTQMEFWPYTKETVFDVHENGTYGLRITTWGFGKTGQIRNIAEPTSISFLRWVEKSPERALKKCRSVFLGKKIEPTKYMSEIFLKWVKENPERAFEQCRPVIQDVQL